MKKISVIIPALNEEKNIAKVISCVKKCNLIDEIIVVDNNSIDRTASIAKEMGTTTLLCKNRGKGYAMECGIKSCSSDYVIFVDGDIGDYESNFLDKMLRPLIDDDYDFVKSSFERTGGRVTELVAKPLLEILFPALGVYNQPLSGIIAGKKALFDELTFEKDYGVDIGILIDVYKLKAKMTQVYIGKITNSSQDWKSLIGMSRQVSKAIIKRSHQKKKKLSEIGS